MVPRVIVGFAALSLGACSISSRACTQIGAVASVSVDARAVASGFDPADVLVCLEDDCLSLMQSDAFGVVRFLDEARGTGRDIEVRTTSGVTLAGPTRVELDEWYPNGRGCEPRVVGGQVFVDAAGGITRVEPAP